MAGINQFSDESMRRIARDIFNNERDAIRSVLFLPPVQPDRPKFVAFRNTSGEEIPAHAVMRVTGAEVKGGLPLITVAKPSTTFQRLYLVNSERRVGGGANARGVGTWLEEAAYVLYEAGTPAVGESWGPKAGQWSLAKWRYGFTIQGAIVAAKLKVVAKQREVDVVYGQSSGTWNVDNNGTVDLYDGNNAAISSTSISVMNRLVSAIPTGRKVVCTWVGGTWLATAMKCT